MMIELTLFQLFVVAFVSLPLGIYIGLSMREDKE